MASSRYFFVVTDSAAFFGGLAPEHDSQRALSNVLRQFSRRRHDHTSRGGTGALVGSGCQLKNNEARREVLEGLQPAENYQGDDVARRIRLLAAAATVIGALILSTGSAHAGMDNELSLVDEKGRTMTVQQWDTFLNGVFPLDRNRLTREWFHSGSARYQVVGSNASEFHGTLELGYQIGFPWSLGVGINFSYTTPNILLDDTNINPLSAGFNPLGKVITPNLFPGVSISADLGNGPGIQEVATFSVDVAGANGKVAVSNAHGTVTGAAGGVMLRPFARLISKDGDSVTTYGEPWNMN